jgi:hypothetical protein
VTTSRLTKKHFVDHGERDADGYYDYYYAYWEYGVHLADRHYGVRVYDDETEVAFVHTAHSRSRDDLRAVLDVLRPEGVTELRMLGRSGGYERVEPLPTLRDALQRMVARLAPEWGRRAE